MAERGGRLWTQAGRRPPEADLRSLRGCRKGVFGPAFASGFKAWGGPVPRSAIMCDPQDLQCAASAASATVSPPLLPAFIVSFAMHSSDPADVKKVAAIVWIRVQMERLGISMDELEAAGCFDWEAAPARAPAEEPIVEESEMDVDVAQALLPAGPITAPPALLPAGPITAPPVVAPAPLRKAVARKRVPAPVRQSAPPAVPVASPVATLEAAPVVVAVAVADAVPAEKPAAVVVAEPAATPAAAPAPARVTMSVPAQKAGAVKPAAPPAASAQAAEAAAVPAAAAVAPASALPQASVPARRYRNAEGQVWDGVGPMPAWLLRAVNAGQSVEHFRVN